VASGAAAAPLNPALGVAEVTAELSDLGVSRLLHDGAASAVTAAAGTGVPASVIGMADGLLHVDGQAGDPRAEAPGPESLALLLHTSGTTSKPKTVPIRQRNLVASTGAVTQTYGLTGDDVTMCVMPLFHVHGLVATVLATLSTGGTVVLPRFRPTAFWDEAGRYGATWYTAVPTIHARLLTAAHALPAPPEHRLRFVRSCSAPLPTVLWQRYEDLVAVPLVEAYGMTEAAHQMASNPLPPGERRPGTVGRATGVEIATLDGDWRPVRPGEEGEVAVRGPSVVDEYLGNPAATQAAFRDGWFRTGDVGRLSADGYLSLVGRVKELINRAGEKISPYEVEDVLLGHPAVAEAAAYPVPDEKYGEQVGVVVVLRDGAAEATPRELAAYCSDRLAAFKRPARVTILPAIPKGPTGKVQRRNLAALVDE
jgi:acyl-CoA synthetase (AMP-forming)/AMP-acid ligase II